jgi:uncharacterized protein YjbI with pentapeptide repeats
VKSEARLKKLFQVNPMPHLATSKCQFKSCAEDALSFHDVCWEHSDHDSYPATLRQGLLTLSGGPTFCLNLKKAHIAGLDFSNLDIRESCFSQAHISNCSFIGANLSGVDMIGARVSSCEFVGSDILRANFMKAVFLSTSFSHADLRGSSFIEAHLRDTDFMGSVLFDCLLWYADISGARNIKQANFRNPDSKKVRPSFHLSEESPLGACESYRVIKHYFYHNGLYEAARWAAYRERIMERKYFYETRDPRYIWSLIIDLVSGYTEKPSRVIISSFVIVMVFAYIYYLFNVPVASAQPGAFSKPGIGDAIYFSFITFTTCGYGDFIPRAVAWMRLLACLEAFSGPFMTGLYIFTLTRRYSAG